MVALITRETEVHIPRWVENDLTEAPVEPPNEVGTEAAAERYTQQLLVARALRGDREAFDEIFAHYSGVMHRTAYRIVKDQDIAQDAVQDAFILAWQRLPSLREAGALRPWLLRIVVNQCISFQRRFARTTLFLRQAMAEQETDVASHITQYYEGYMERNWDLALAIEKLPAKQQLVLALHYYQGMTLPEISRALHVSENTLKKRIQAALKNLRLVLRDAEMDEAFASY